MAKVTVIGDVMLDKYSYGNVDRLNPEAPNPLITLNREEERLGGAANVAANIAALLGSASLIGCVGKDTEKDRPDKSGRSLVQECEDENIEFHPIQVEGIPTITKHRFIENTYNQQLLRADREKYIQLDKKHRELVMDCLNVISPDMVVISDYAKGTIDEPLMQLVREYIQSNNKRKLLVDTKPKNLALFKNAYLIKPNFKEFCAFIGKNIPNEDDVVEIEAKRFIEDYNTNLVITRGAKGATLVTTDGKVSHLHTLAQNVFDVTGAGDTFIAAITASLAKGNSIEQAIVDGNTASGIAVGKIGTAVVTAEEMNRK